MEHFFSRRSGVIRIIAMDENHSELYRQMRNKEENRRFFFSEELISEEGQRRWYENYLRDDSQLMFAITEEEKFIGGCGLYRIDREKEIAEFGRILIDKKRRWGGIGKTAVELILSVAKDELGLSKVFLKVKSDNIPAVRVYEKVGFRMATDDIHEGRHIMEVSL